MNINRETIKKACLFINQPYLFAVVSKVLGVMIAVVYSAIYSRYLGASLKGEAAIIGNYASILSSVACLGMYQAYPFYRKKDEDIFYPFLNNMTSLYLLIIIATVCFSLLARGLENNIRIALILFPIQSFIRHINYVVTIENPKKHNVTSILINVVDLVIVVIFWLCTEATYQFLSTILFAQTIINLLLSYKNLNAELKYFRFTLSRIPQYAKFGFVPMITLFLMTINYRVDVLMLENMGDISKAQIGIYSVGVSLSEKVWLIPDALKDILLSRLCKGQGEKEVSMVIRLSLFITGFIILAMVLLARPFILFVYGSEYLGADTVTILMLFGVIGMIFYKMIYVYNISLGKRWINLAFLAIAAIINVIGNILLIPKYGIYGAVISSVVSYSICGMCFLVFFQRSTRMPYHKILTVQKEDIQIIKKFL